MQININADLGESYGCFTIGNDDALLGVVASANVACGLHGGDPQIMQDTVLNAKRKGVSIGAHPGFADLHGFGRRAMSLAEDDLVALLVYQLGAVAAMGRAHDWPISHVKPHGALNNQACADPALAAIVAHTVARFDPALILLAPAGSELAAAGQLAGLSVRFEIFADRTYEADGQLTPRSVEGSVLHDVGEVCDHVMQMMDRGGIITRQGLLIETRFDSICVHGDGRTAVGIANGIRSALLAAGHQIRPLNEMS